MTVTESISLQVKFSSFQIHFNNVFPFTRGSSEWSYGFRFHSLCCVSACCMSPHIIIHLELIALIISYLMKFKVTVIFIMQFSATGCYIALSSCPNTHLGALFSNTLTLFFPYAESPCFTVMPDEEREKLRVLCASRQEVWRWGILDGQATRVPRTEYVLYLQHFRI